MWAFIWLGLLSLVIVSLVIYSKYEKRVAGFNDYYDDYLEEGERGSERPNDYTVEIANQTKILQPPFPPCVGFVDEVVYAPNDTNADIAQIKADLANLRKDIPNYVTDGVNEQGLLLMKGLLRQQGFPLSEDQYGQTLGCN
jgi:hypothetical protein